MKTPAFKTAIATATAAMAFSAVPALAASDELPTQSVRFADLNLNTPEGQARLDQRIESAAKSVCRVNEVRTGTRIRSPQVGACLANARASAKKQVSAKMSETRYGG